MEVRGQVLPLVVEEEREKRSSTAIDLTKPDDDVNGPAYNAVVTFNL